MNAGNLVSFGIGALAGYYLVCHYIKTQQAF